MIAPAAPGPSGPQQYQHDSSARRLFVHEERPNRLLNEPMSDASLVLSHVSTIESPDCQKQPDFMTSDEDSAMEFSTEVSSTRKRRNQR